MSSKAKPRPQPAGSTRWLFKRRQTQRFAELGALTATEPVSPPHDNYPYHGAIKIKILSLIQAEAT